MSLNILLIAPKIKGAGGIEQHVSGLKKTLEKRGLNVHCISCENTPCLHIKGIANISFAISSSLNTLLSRNAYDLVHAHSLPSAFPMRFFSCPKILTFHGIYSLQIASLYGKPLGALASVLEKKVIKWANAITTVSRLDQQYLKKLGAKAYYVPNAIDLEEMPSEGLRLYDRQAIYLGRLSKEKGVDILIKAFTCEELSEVHLLIVGKGPEEAHLRRLAGGRPNIHFIGEKPRYEALKYVKGSDILLLPSRREGMPTTLLEAMALKTPIIASAVGGCLELIENGQNGVLVQPDDHISLRQAIISAFSDKNRMRKLAEHAYQRVINEFSWEKAVERYLQIYELVLNEHPKT